MDAHGRPCTVRRKTRNPIYIGNDWIVQFYMDASMDAHGLSIKCSWTIKSFFLFSKTGFDSYGLPMYCPWTSMDTNSTNSNPQLKVQKFSVMSMYCPWTSIDGLKCIICFFVHEQTMESMDIHKCAWTSMGFKIL